MSPASGTTRRWRTGIAHLGASRDNLRKGAALNAVQIAQLLHERGLIETRQAA